MLERGFQSAASIPITYDEYLYGLLAIYSDKPQTFVGETTETLVRFGKIIGHALQAGERERALTTDSVVRVEFRNQAMADRLYDAYDDTVDFKATSERIFTVDGRHHLLMRATGVSASKYGALLKQFQAIEESKIVDGGTDEDTNGLVSITVSDDSATGVIIEHGGMPRSLTFDESGLTLSADLPPYVDVRSVAEELADLYPGTRMVSKRTVPREMRVSGGDSREVLGDLTEKQRVALETAHHTGYFEWPRNTTAEEVAELLQISSSTMSEHLRSGQRKVFNAVFDTSTAGSLSEE
jgi:predicted DNA binding protein